MNTGRAIRLLSFLAALAAVAGGPAAAAENRGAASRSRPDRDRPAVARPTAQALPDDLAIRAPEAESEAAAARKGVDGAAVATRPDGRTPVGVSRAAYAAATWAAREVVQRSGVHEYYRVGWYLGLRRALDEPTLGGWDYRLGVRLGERDPDARRVGLEAGAAQATEDATAAAEARVEAQFVDLDRDPVRDARAVAGTWSARRPFLETPELRGVFADHPIDGARFAALRGWSYDPWSLSRLDSYDAFLDRKWNDRQAAFEAWSRDRRRAAAWFALRSASERAAFRASFDVAFDRALAIEHRGALDRAFRDGWDDGWDYGSIVVFEYNFRRGQAEGYDRAASRAAADAYGRQYDPAYRRAYDEAFESWSTHAVPGVSTVTLIDGNDDGVFEPGETVVVQVDAVNYGKGSDRLPVRVDGDRLAGPAIAEVEVRGRGAIPGLRPLRVTVVPDAPLRSVEQVEVAVGDAVATAEFRVGRPLEIDADVALDAEPLAGRAAVAVRVVNRSRRQVGGVLRADRGDGVAVPAVAVDALAPGTGRTLTVAMDGARPADLLGGSFEARFSVVSDGVLQDALDWRAPDRAVDLGSRDFVRWVESLAGDPRTASRDVDDARALLARRLAVDWSEAVRGRGNPYKRDLKQGSATTAVGELVAARRASGKRPARPEVFAALADEIEVQADGLPGAHPLLRKALRKLARKLR